MKSEHWKKLFETYTASWLYENELYLIYACIKNNLLYKRSWSVEEVGEAEKVPLSVALFGTARDRTADVRVGSEETRGILD